MRIRVRVCLSVCKLIYVHILSCIAHACVLCVCVPELQLLLCSPPIANRRPFRVPMALSPRPFDTAIQEDPGHVGNDEVKL